MDEVFVETFRADDNSVVVNDLGGVGWYEAPLPPRFHRCRVQTEGWMNYFTLMERCACGAISIDGRGWWQRNTL